MNKKIKLKYTKSWKVHTNKGVDPIYAPVYGYKSVSSVHYKRYYNTLCILAGVGGASRNVLDYFCERMDSNNIVHSNAQMRKQFIKDISTWTKGKVVYTDGTVKKAIHKLVLKDLLIKQDKRGTLKVNPEYFFKGEEVYRYKEIQAILEFKTDKPNE